MSRYLDSSVILRYLLQSPGFLNPFSAGSHFISSKLTRLECRRTLHRLRLEGKIDDGEHGILTEKVYEILSRIDLAGISDHIMRLAETNWGSIVGSLDSIHLATALVYRESTKSNLQFVTHDRALATAAQIHGFGVTS